MNYSNSKDDIKVRKAGSMAFTWVVGVYGIIVGTIQLALAVSVHHEVKVVEVGVSKARVR